MQSGNVKNNMEEMQKRKILLHETQDKSCGYQFKKVIM